MNSPIEPATWNNVEGAYYVGANTAWEPIWLFVSIAMCLAALWMGSRHEKKSYEKSEK
ncbi:MAG: hypothetical protein V7727_21255 [Sneathiella sp.]